MSYAIHIEQHYYSGALTAPKSGVMRDHGYDIIAVATQDEADRIVKMLDWEPGDRPTVLDNNEYAPPTYSAVKSTATARSIEDAMFALGLNYDFDPATGDKIEMTESQLFGD